ncbi:MAG: hypothetical protein U1D30_03540 [Planctomycetota bacterium]
MRHVIRLSLVAYCFTPAALALAGPHLGMKLACKEYGDAWRSGSLSRLSAAVTSDFAVAWQRIPPETFASLPRTGGGEVLGTNKFRGSGLVTVQTNEGVVEFVVVGGGFDWKVADIRRPDRRGKIVSVKETLLASSAARNFIVRFSDLDDTNGYRLGMSRRLAAVAAAIPIDSMTRVRRCLPKGSSRNLPDVWFHSHGVTVTVPLTRNDASQSIAFHLVKEEVGEWKVDDVTFATPSLSVRSLRTSLPALAVVADFGALAKRENAPPVERIVAEGDLRDEFRWLASQDRPMPGPRTGPPHRVEAKGNQAVHLYFPDREVRFHVTNGVPTAISRVEVIRDGNVDDLASLLAKSRQVEQIAGEGVIGKVLGYVFSGGE